MLGSASGSSANYPGHPPAAPGGLLSLVPDLVLGPRKALDIGELQQPVRKRYDPLFRHEVAGADGLGSPGYQTGTSEAQPDEHGPATSPEGLGSWETAKFHTVRQASAVGGPGLRLPRFTGRGKFEAHH